MSGALRAYGLVGLPPSPATSLQQPVPLMPGSRGASLTWDTTALRAGARPWRRSSRDVRSSMGSGEVEPVEAEDIEHMGSEPVTMA